jgi:hypothetical protein
MLSTLEFRIVIIPSTSQAHTTLIMPCARTTTHKSDPLVRGSSTQKNGAKVHCKYNTSTLKNAYTCTSFRSTKKVYQNISSCDPILKI